MNYVLAYFQRGEFAEAGDGYRQVFVYPIIDPRYVNVFYGPSLVGKTFEKNLFGRMVSGEIPFDPKLCLARTKEHITAMEGMGVSFDRTATEAFMASMSAMLLPPPPPARVRTRAVSPGLTMNPGS